MHITKEKYIYKNTKRMYPFYSQYLCIIIENYKIENSNRKTNNLSMKTKGHIRNKTYIYIIWPPLLKKQQQ